eukprot:2616225-Pyramimonas_sp.AAC.1
MPQTVISFVDDGGDMPWGRDGPAGQRPVFSRPSLRSIPLEQARRTRTLDVYIIRCRGNSE